MTAATVITLIFVKAANYSTVTSGYVSELLETGAATAGSLVSSSQRASTST